MTPLIIPYLHSLILQIEKLGDTYYLLKRNVVLADTGKYICVASNEIGKAHCSAFVTVLGDLSCQLHASWHPLALLWATCFHSCTYFVTGKKNPKTSSVAQAKPECEDGYSSEEVNITTTELVQAQDTPWEREERPEAECTPVR